MFSGRSLLKVLSIRVVESEENHRMAYLKIFALLLVVGLVRFGVSSSFRSFANGVLKGLRGK